MRSSIERGSMRVRWDAFTGGRSAFLVALTSILWREAWKYGERAFRYCQHDTGHALAAMRLSASLLGWNLAVLPRWSDASLSTLLGLDRDSDYDGAEREEPELIAVVTAGEVAPWLSSDPAPLVAAAREATWSGVANRLSADHAPWPIIDEVSDATRYPGFAVNSQLRNSRLPTTPNSQPPIGFNAQRPRSAGEGCDPAAAKRRGLRCEVGTVARAISVDARASSTGCAAVGRDRLAAAGASDPVRPSRRGLTPGVYAYLRDPAVLDEWRAAMRPEFLWERDDPTTRRRCSCLFPSDVMWTANRLSCDQDIAADGFFSLGMIARLERSLSDRGEWFYRRLFWECGMIGQVLYLEAEAAGARATGIGCFYDDAVHELLGSRAAAGRACITSRWVFRSTMRV